MDRRSKEFLFITQFPNTRSLAVKRKVWRRSSVTVGLTAIQRSVKRCSLAYVKMMKIRAYKARDIGTSRRVSGASNDTQGSHFFVLWRTVSLRCLPIGLYIGHKAKPSISSAFRAFLPNRVIWKGGFRQATSLGLLVSVPSVPIWIPHTELYKVLAWTLRMK